MESGITAYGGLVSPGFHLRCIRATCFGTRGYSYDANGNRTGLTREAESMSYAYAPASNRLAAIDAAPVTLDATGNTRTQAGQSYTYTAHQRLATAGGASYRYNGLGQRVEKTVNGTTTRYVYGLDGALLAETDAAGAVQVEYIYLEGAPLAVRYATGPVPLAYVHPDHLGTPRVLTDAAGVMVWRATYDPFGAATVTADPDGDGHSVTFNLRLPGQYYDAKTGLHYNYFRTYDPSLGRYLESDPIGLEGGLNTYAYVDNNPLRWIDPLGLFTVVSGFDGTGLPFAEYRRAREAYNRTPAGMREQLLIRLGEQFQQKINSLCEKDRQKLQEIFDRWVVYVDPNIDNPTRRIRGTAADTWYSRSETQFNYWFFNSQNQYFTFSHEFRHPMELDADRWPQQFLDGGCSCGY